MHNIPCNIHDILSTILVPYQQVPLARLGFSPLHPLQYMFLESILERLFVVAT